MARLLVVCLHLNMRFRLKLVSPEKDMCTCTESSEYVRMVYYVASIKLSHEILRHASMYTGT